MFGAISNFGSDFKALGYLLFARVSLVEVLPRVFPAMHPLVHVVHKNDGE